MASGPRPRHVIGFAHRGARAHAPENTIEAFLTACRMGATALETDVWLSRDGQVVIDHDGRIGSWFRSVPIGRVDATDLPDHLPTLAELQAAVGTRIQLSIDVKDPAAIDGILAVRAAGGPEALAATWLCDPDIARLATWRALDPHVRLVASVRRHHLRSIRLDELRDIGIDAVNLPHRHWSPELVRRVHRRGLAAFAWGVQCPHRMRTLVRWQIDALYSDHTDRLVAVVDS